MSWRNARLNGYGTFAGCIAGVLIYAWVGLLAYGVYELFEWIAE